MATPKKIFFSYSNKEEDLQLYNKINRHFAGYSRIGLVGIIDRTELFRTAGDREQALEQIKKADLAVPLLSIDYVTDDECLQQLEKAANSQVKIVPVLLRDFDWEAHQDLSRYKNQMLPDDHSPVEKHIAEDQNDDTVFKEIAQSVKALILPEIGSLEWQKPAGTFYYIMAALVMTIGIIASVIIYRETEDLGSTEQVLFSVLCFLMFGCIALIALKNVLFPNKVRLKR